MKIALASFFLMIFSFQVLPVKELGKMLFKKQLTEEAHEAADATDDTGDLPEFKLKKDDDPYTSSVIASIYATKVAPDCNNLGVLDPEHISKQFIPDILTPPPNMA